ncbi:MAG: RdgB/HAM1 family non-canonical purine NTP pyrophosphatase [Myxococcota bacterium]
MTRLLLATRNPGKVREILQLFEEGGLRGVVVETLADHPGIGEIEETGKTFEENARVKATVAAQRSGCWALGEDSGIELEALGGAPGVRSARYAGEPADDAANNAKLLRELADTADRRARYACVAMLSSPQGEIVARAGGSCEGVIGREARGEGGFGYDPYFVPQGESRTMAQLSPDEKGAISHRGQALRALLPALRAHLEAPIGPKS